MPKVPELNLPKFNSMPSSKNERFEARYWRYKKKTPPKDVYKPKKTKLIDKHLINDNYDMQQHVRSIRNEE